VGGNVFSQRLPPPGSRPLAESGPVGGEVIRKKGSLRRDSLFKQEEVYAITLLQQQPCASCALSQPFSLTLGIDPAYYQQTYIYNERIF